MTEINSKNKQNFLKVLSLFSVVRGYNVLALVLAQYLASIFVFSPSKSLRYVLLDKSLFFIVLASVCVVASGYIINNFYDREKDLINSPVKSKIDNYVSQRTRLNLYFLLNFIGVSLSFLVSWRAALFFSVYIFWIWFYSHKLQKHPIIGWVLVTLLTIAPFFAIFIYYKNYANIILVHAVFVFLLFLLRELIKDLEKVPGNIAQNNQTITVKYGDKVTKILATIITVLTYVVISGMFGTFEIGLMEYYFIGVVFLLLFFIIYLWISKTKKQYILLHNLLKVIIVLGVFSLVLIDQSVIIERLI
ncbi:MAG: ubiquinone biosynthesis protein UbiA [Lutibacter sp.]|nr:MAG: ubiquinone biosynthesis protein UbiA [Lutibacter sp.]